MPTFAVNGRVFATLGWPDKSWGMVKLPPELQDALVRASLMRSSRRAVRGVGRAAPWCAWRRPTQATLKDAIKIGVAARRRRQSRKRATKKRA